MDVNRLLAAGAGNRHDCARSALRHMRQNGLKQLIYPRYFTSNAWRNTSPSISRNGPNAGTATVVARTSIRPIWATTCSAAFSTPMASVTSTLIARATLPTCSISSASSPNALSDLADIAIFCPFSRKGQCYFTSNRTCSPSHPSYLILQSHIHFVLVQLYEFFMRQSLIRRRRRHQPPNSGVRFHQICNAHPISVQLCFRYTTSAARCNSALGKQSRLVVYL